MPQHSAELFNLSTTTPAGGLAHGSAMTRGNVSAGATFRRGIDLSAGFDFRAEARGALGDQLSAKLTAGVSARGGLAVQAAFPLDLFTEAGLVARFQAQAEAAAYVSLALGLSLDELSDLLTDKTPEPLADALEIFLDEVVIEAGFWARAAFAAEVLGQGTLAGSLLPSANRSPGFSFSLQYGAGLGYGTGKEFVANIGFEDPRRLLTRLADSLSALVLKEAETALAAQPEAAREAAAPALTLARMLLPLATRTTFQLGLDLATMPDSGRREAAAASIVESFGAEAQRLLLEALCEVAGKKLADLLGGDAALEAVLTDDELRADARGRLQSLVDALDRLDSTDLSQPKVWLAALVDCLDPLEGLLDLGLLPSDLEAQCRRTLAMLWAAGTLLERVAGWTDNPARGVADLFGATAVTVPGAGGIGAEIATALDRQPGAGLTLADLVEFLVGAELVAELRASPTLGPALDWLAQAADTPTGEILHRALVELAEPDTQTVDGVLIVVGTALGEALADQVGPKVLDPIKKANPDNEALALVIDQIVVPLLGSLPIVVIPALPNLDREEGRVRLREAISAVLIQVVQRFVISTVDILLQRALTDGEAALRELAQEVERLDEEWPGLGAIAVIASRSVLPVSITPADVKGILELAAGVTHLINENQREPMLGFISEALALGLSTEESRAVAMSNLANSDAPADEDDLDALLERSMLGAWEIAEYAAPKLLELIALHYFNEVKEVAVAVYEGAKAVVEAIEKGMDLIAAEMAKLAERLEQLAILAAQQLAQIAGHIAALAQRARQLASDAVESVRSLGLDLLNGIIGWMPEWAQNELRSLYNAAFDAIKWVLDAPLAVLDDVATWAQQAIDQGLSRASVDSWSAKEAIRSGIHAAGADDLHFDLAIYAWGQKVFDAGRVTIPAGDVLNAISDVVLGDPVVDGTVNAAAKTAVDLQATRAEQATVEQLKVGAEGQQQASADAANLVPGKPLAIRFLKPQSETSGQGRIRLHVRIDGANSTFVEPTLGVPRRVTLRINGRDWSFEPTHWQEDSNGIELVADVVPLEQPAPMPEPAQIVPPVLEVIRPTDVGVRLERTQDAEELVFARLDEMPSRIAPGVTEGALFTRAPMVEAAAAPAMWTASRSEAPRIEETEAPAAASEARRLAARGRLAIADGPAEATATEGEAGAPLGRVPLEGLSRPTAISAAIAAMDSAPDLDAQPVSRADGLARASFQATRSSTPISRDTARTLAEVLTIVEPEAEASVTIGGQLGLNVVQVAVSDGKQETASDRVLFFLEPEPPRAVVADVVYDPAGSDVEGEHVVIRSQASAALDLEGWTIRDLAGHTYPFPEISLAPGATLRLWTGKGTNGPSDLYWGRGAAVWNNAGDSAILSDETGHEVHRFSYRGTGG